MMKKKRMYMMRIMLILLLLITTVLPHFNVTASANEVIETPKTVQILITMLDGKQVLPPTDVPFTDGETVFDILQRVTTEKNISLSVRSTEYGKYIEGIHDLYEFDKGPLSGWMYSVNGELLNYSADLRKLEQGDRIAWRYTENLGADVGDTSNSITIKPVEQPEVVTPSPAPDSKIEIIATEPTPQIVPEKKAEEIVTPVVSQPVPNPTTEIIAIEPTPQIVPEKKAEEIVTPVVSQPVQDPKTEIIATEPTPQIVPEKKAEEIVIPVASKTEPEKQVEAIVTKETSQPVSEEKDNTVSTTIPQVINQDAETAKLVPEQAYNNVANYMLKTVANPGYGNEWFIITLARGHYAVPANYYETYYQNLEQHVRSVKGELNSRKYTEYARVILALSAIGKDARNVGGYNLVEKLYDFNKIVAQGVNGPIFALIALDSQQYDIPASASNSRQRMIDTIVSKQLADGGFALSGTQADADMTAMAIQALSTYKDQPQVAKVIDHALEALANLQQADGNFKIWDVANVESVAQVITALTSIGIDPIKDERFKTTMDALLSFYNEADGGFKHIQIDKSANGIATEQAGYSLASYKRFVANQTKLYDMTDVALQVAPPIVVNPAIIFTDINTHWAKSFIDEAVQLKLLKGFSDGTFKPQQQLTRVQAASIIVRALSLTAEGTAPFADVTSFATSTQAEMAAAYEAGIIKGSNGLFKPNDKVTRMQLALMLARAYAYKKGQPYVSSTPLPFSDVVQYNAESKQAVAMLYDFEIISGNNGLFKPEQFTTRAQAAKMLVNFHKVLQEQ